MRTKLLVLVGTCAAMSLTYAATRWEGAYRAFTGEYLIYSGELGEEAEPTSTDRKAAIVFQGDIAKNLFASIGPDLKDGCGASSGMRIREKGDVDCTYDKTDKSPYTCHVGIDLRTGKSIRGSIC